MLATNPVAALVPDPFKGLVINCTHNSASRMSRIVDVKFLFMVIYRC